MRLLLAAEMLGHPGRSVQSVAKACGYSSDSGLRRACSDFLGASPRELGRAQAFRRVADAFVRELEGAPRMMPSAALEIGELVSVRLERAVPVGTQPQWGAMSVQDRRWIDARADEIAAGFRLRIR
jgi:AraC-like DNA-binding protein